MRRNIKIRKNEPTQPKRSYVRSRSRYLPGLSKVRVPKENAKVRSAWRDEIDEFLEENYYSK